MYTPLSAWCFLFLDKGVTIYIYFFLLVLLFFFFKKNSKDSGKNVNQEMCQTTKNQERLEYNSSCMYIGKKARKIRETNLKKHERKSGNSRNLGQRTKHSNSIITAGLNPAPPPAFFHRLVNRCSTSSSTDSKRQEETGRDSKGQEETRNLRNPGKEEIRRVSSTTAELWRWRTTESGSCSAVNTVMTVEVVAVWRLPIDRGKTVRAALLQQQHGQRPWWLTVAAFYFSLCRWWR